MKHDEIAFCRLEGPKWQKINERIVLDGRKPKSSKKKEDDKHVSFVCRSGLCKLDKRQQDRMGLVV